MPELPEVETVRRGLNQVTLNQQIWGGDVLLARTIAYPISVVDFLTGLTGSAIAQWHRRGKYLLAELIKPSSHGQGNGGAAVHRHQQDNGGKSLPDSRPEVAPPLPSGEIELASPQSSGWLGVHLRMTGQMLWLNRDEPVQKHSRVRLFFGDQELRFVDQRTFGQMWWVPPGTVPENIITGLQRLGSEPFSPEFSIEYLTKQLQSRRRPIKTALLDQATVAGLGNIYADEALFLSGIRPETLCTHLTSEQIERLRAAIIQVLQASIDVGGTTFSNFLNVQGINGNYGGVAWVYNRTGAACRVCTTPIVRLKLAGRSSHFCPQCQR